MKIPKPATMPESGSDPDANPKKVLFGKYELGKLLGRGASAKVYSAHNLATDNSVAVKIIPKSRISKSTSFARTITREVAILRRLRHPHIVHLHEVLASRSKIYFILEFAKGGALFTHVEKFGRLPENLTRKYFHQLIAAVGYCHSRGVFHRDLKPENLLLDENNDLRVSDFGLSALADPDHARPDGLLHTLCGTPAYVAPEILAKKGYDGARVDVWSCGVILYVLNAGYLPFNDTNLINIYRKIYRGEYRIPQWTSPDLKRLISRILDTNPETRMTIEEIVRDPWFKKGLDEEKWTAMMRFRDEEKDEEECDRELNAFDLISFSSGVNLSGLFEPSGSDRKRFAVEGPGEGILGRVEAVGMREGCFVRREGQNGKGRVVVRGQNGNLAVRIGVHRLTGLNVVVEVDVGGDAWAQEFWREKVGPLVRGGDGRRAVEGREVTGSDRSD